MSYEYDPWFGQAPDDIRSQADAAIARARRERDEATAAGYTAETWPKHRQPNPFTLAARMDEIADHRSRLQAPSAADLANAARAAQDRADREFAAAEAARKRRLREAGVPAREAEALDWALEARSSLAAVQAFLRDRDAWALVLAGAIGNGKTTAACWGLMHAPGDGHFAKAYEVAQTPAWEPKRQTYEKTGFLVIDELGAEYGDSKSFGLSNLWQILDRRYDDKRKTVITLNMSPDKFRERYGTQGGERFFDRLRDGGCVFVCSEQESLRGLEHPTQAHRHRAGADQCNG
jgi:hypothetical protein